MSAGPLPAPSAADAAPWRALRLVELVRPVADMPRAVAFYCDALGFVPDGQKFGSAAQAGDAALAAALATAWAQEPHTFTRLRLGRQTLLLAACAGLTARAAAGWPDAGADDPRFQHIAIVAPDIDAAWQRVQAHAPGLRTVSRGGPVRLPAASGGVSACKFRDPDGHPVEFIAFAPGQVPPRWQTGSDAAPAGAPACGIDHSAITVADAGRSVDFYRRLLGLRQTSRQTNRGPEQALLDGLPAPEIDVVGLAVGGAAAAGAGGADGLPPHLELLGYHHPGGAAWPLPDPPQGPRTCTVWAVQGAGAAPAGRHPPPHVATRHDPDGHTLLLLSSPPFP